MLTGITHLNVILIGLALQQLHTLHQLPKPVAVDHRPAGEVW